ncbi:putative short chain dehydrogenase [Xylariaceae sp. FL0016]|nr:putative short chain dehydrogenase [Xylariaceae sp. FL0016]
MEPKIVLITGGNTGIGYEAIKALLRSDRTYTVLMGSRSPEKADAAVAELRKEVPGSPSSTVEAVQMDVTSDEQIARAAEGIRARHGRLDVLVNNAGAMYDHEVKRGTLGLRDSWSQTFDVNVVSAYMVTHALLPLLLRSPDPRLLFVTSGLSSLSQTSERFYPLSVAPAPGWPKEDTGGADSTAYRCAKAGLNMMMVSLAFYLSRDGVKTWGVSPGFLATGLGQMREEMRRRGAGHPGVGGGFIREVVEGGRDGDVGMVVRSDGSVQPW